LSGSLAGIGLAWCLAYPPICGYLLIQTCRITGLPARRYLAELRRPVISAMLCGAITLPGLLLLPPGALRLFLNCALAGACLACCLLFDTVMRQLFFSIVLSRPSKA
jgi:hypothetical protein